jgi:hypothetical protein
MFDKNAGVLLARRGFPCSHLPVFVTDIVKTNINNIGR